MPSLWKVLGRRRRFRPVRAARVPVEGKNRKRTKKRTPAAPPLPNLIDACINECMSAELSTIFGRMSTEFCATLIK